MKKFSLLFLMMAALFLIQVLVGESAPLTAQVQPKNSEPEVLASFKLTQPFPRVPEKMMVYAAESPDISTKDVKGWIKTFGLNGEIVKRQKQFVVKDQKKVLEVFFQPATGYLRFSNDAKLAVEEEAKNLPSKEEAIHKAREFLKSHGLLPENTFLAGVGYHEFRKYDLEGKILEQGKSGIKVGFGFTLDGMKVAGPGAKVNVVFGSDGEIIGAARIWRKLRPAKEVKILTPDEALAKFKQRWPAEAEPERFQKAKIRTAVNIKKVDLTYFAKPGCVPQLYMEPVYIFNGDYRTSRKPAEEEIRYGDRFTIVIPAIPEEK